MKRLITLAGAACILSGCVTVSQQPINAVASASLKGEGMAAVAHAKPDFVAMTAGKAAFAMLGAAAMISEGNEIVKTNKLEDPATAISAGLAAALASSHGVKLKSGAAVVDGDELDKLVAAAGESRFVLDVQTINWSFAYFPTDWTHYRVIYSAKARVIDAKNKSVVAESFCSRVPESDGKAPTYDELLANSAARLKSELTIAAEACVQNFKSNMLKI